MSKGHKPNILHHDKHGYVAHCTCCDAFSVAFGNAYLKLSLIGLKQLSHSVGIRYQEVQTSKKVHQRDIYLDSPFDGFGMILSLRELERFHHILLKTLLILEARDEIRKQ